MSPKLRNGILLGAFVFAGSTLMPALGQSRPIASQVASRVLTDYQPKDFNAISGQIGYRADASGVVTRYVTALQKREFKTVIDLTLSYQQDVNQIKSSNPQVLWPKLIGDYYRTKTALFSQSADFWQNYFETLFASGGDPTQGIRAAMGLLPASCKWSISESRQQRVRDMWNGREYNQATVYTTVSYPAWEDAPLLGNRMLEQTIVQIVVDLDSQLVVGMGRVPAADTFKKEPLRIVSVFLGENYSGMDLTYIATGGIPPFRCRVMFGSLQAQQDCSNLSSGRFTTHFDWNVLHEPFPIPASVMVTDSKGRNDGVSLILPAFPPVQLNIYPLWTYCWIRDPWFKTGMGRSNEFQACKQPINQLGYGDPRPTSIPTQPETTRATPAPPLPLNNPPCSQATDLGYSLQVDGRTYKVSGIGPFGPKRTHIFHDSTGNVIQDPKDPRLPKLALAAWTKEFIVDRYSPWNGSEQVRAFLANSARLQGWQEGVDLLARTTVEAIAAVVTAGESAGTMPTRLTRGELERQFADPKVVLVRWVRAGLERSLADYTEMEGILQSMSRTAPDLSNLERIAALYTEANTIASVHEALAAAIAPTTWQDVFSQYLKSAVSELPIQSTAFLTVKDVLSLEQLVAGVGQAFNAYKQSLDLVLGLYKTNEQVIASWAAAAARGCNQSEQSLSATGLLDELNGGSIGEAQGIRWIHALGDHGAVFTAASSSRIEYPTQIPSEGTLEFWIKVDSGYQYSNYVFMSNLDRAMIFSTDALGGDVTWPGVTKLTVSRNGEILLYMAIAKYNRPAAVPTEAGGTRFRFGEWHAIGISYGSQGQFIMVDGTVVASVPNRTQTLGRAGNHQTPLDVPTIGETVSHFWSHHQHEGGFEGVLARFRVSAKQQDWYLARGIGD